MAQYLDPQSNFYGARLLRSLASFGGACLSWDRKRNRLGMVLFGMEGSHMPDTNDKISYRIDEAVKASGLGRSFLYERIAEGALRSVKVGGRRLIMRRDLLEFIDGGNSVKSPAPAPTNVPATEADANGLAQWTQLELPLKQRR
jgi:excisionase family DNA binding protein